MLTNSSRRDRIKVLLAQGISAAKIAAEVGCAPSTVHRIRNGQGSRKGNRAAYLSVGAKVTERECNALDRLVVRGVAPSRSALIRDMLRRAGDYYAPTPEEDAFLAKASGHLSRLGGNFNQIANALSASVKKTGKADPTSEQIARMREAADEIQLVRGIVGAMLNNAQTKIDRLKQTVDVSEASYDE